MKIIYTLFLAMCCGLLVSAQDRYWVGGTSGNWSSAANWSTTPGGAGGASVPGASNIAKFTSSATVDVDDASITILGLHVLGASEVRLVKTIADDPANIQVTSTDPLNPAVQIDPSSRLIDSNTVTGTEFLFTLGSDARGVVNGEWRFTGTYDPYSAPGSAHSRLVFPPGAASGTLLQVNGIFKIATQGSAPILNASQAPFFQFNASSIYWHHANGGQIARASWNPNATAYLSGALSVAPTITAAYNGTLGNVVIDFAEQESRLQISVTSGLSFAGDFQVRNTNNQDLVFSSATASAISNTFQRDLVINPNAHLVLVGNGNATSYTFTVGEDLILNGGSLKFRTTYPAPYTATTPVTLNVQGNVVAIGGRITSADIPTTLDFPYIVQMAGSTPQSITAVGGDWDNTDHQITLRIDNPAGVTLNSPLQVSNISWNSTNKGNLITSSGNVLTLLNPSTDNDIVMEGVSNDGYVQGPVRRVTNSTDPYYFPIGDGGVFRTLALIPENSSSAVFEATYFSGAFSNTTTGALLSGISLDEYWRVNTISGTTAAQVALSLNGAISGAGYTDGIVVSYFDGSRWQSSYTGDAGSNIVTPGDVTTGTALTDYTTASRYYTFGFGSATILPIELLYFKVAKGNLNTAVLQWGVTRESTPVAFEVERSLNGVNFATIANVAATDAETYQFHDNELPAGTVYYRLNMKDIDGSVKYSDIQYIVNNIAVNKVQLFPTVTSAQTQLKIESVKNSRVTIVITDNQGKIVQRTPIQVSAGAQNVPVNVQSLANGLYYVSLILEDGQLTAPLKLIRQ